jgi:hypothetical protein
VASPEFAIEELMPAEDEASFCAKSIEFVLISMFLQIQRVRELTRQGASLALTAIASHFGADAPTKVPFLWETLLSPIKIIKDPPKGTSRISLLATDV